VIYHFRIKMTAFEFLPYYRGEVQYVIVTAFQGVKVQFPAMHLRQYLTAEGIEGTFCMETENNKFKSLTKIP